MDEKEKEQEKKPEKTRLSRRVRISMGIVLVTVGVVAILSAILVPIINRKNNDDAVADILSGKYADTGEASREAVTAEGADAEAQETVPEASEPSERDIKLAGILADDTRIGIVEIEKLDVLYAIVEGTEDAQINRAIGHISSSAGIGKPGNCVIAGHRGGYYGTFFERLPELETGDEVVLTDLNGVRYHYVVYEQLMVDPPDWSVTENLTNLNGETMSTLTLITCEDDTRKRIVVHAALYENEIGMYQQ